MGQGGWFEGAMGALIIVALAQAALLAVMLTPHVTSSVATPLVSWTDDSEALAQSLRAPLLEAIASAPANQLNGMFSAAATSVARFNLEGLESAFQDPFFAPLRPFFDLVRPRGANAFVLNTISIEGAPCDGPQQRQPAVGLHLDTTVGVTSMRTFVAHSVHVLYVSVASDAGGGRLELFEPHMGSRVSALSKATPSDAVEPKVGRLVEFRGDAIHRISGYCGSGARVSVVLEAYKIPWPFYGATVRHDLVDKRRAGVSADQRADYAICALIVTVMAIFLLYISQQDFE